MQYFFLYLLYLLLVLCIYWLQIMFFKHLGQHHWNHRKYSWNFHFQKQIRTCHSTQGLQYRYTFFCFGIFYSFKNSTIKALQVWIQNVLCLVMGLATAALWEVEGDIWALVVMMARITPPQMMCCPAHISMNASLSHYLYIMATTPRRGQASSRLISPLTARPKEKWEARQSCSPLIHRLHLTPQLQIACSRQYMAFVISLYSWHNCPQ